MSANTELAILSSYNRIIPKITAAGLSAEVEFAKRNDRSEYATGIKTINEDEHLYIVLALRNETDEIINNYRWEYMDFVTGTVVKSRLDYTATEEKVIEFFNHSLEITKEVINTLT